VAFPGASTLPRRIYANREQSPKPESDSEITQAALDRAFKQQQREAHYIVSGPGYEVVLLNGKQTGYDEALLGRVEQLGMELDFYLTHRSPAARPLPCRVPVVATRTLGQSGAWNSRVWRICRSKAIGTSFALKIARACSTSVDSSRRGIQVTRVWIS
jgi:hypothetical protein